MNNNYNKQEVWNYINGKKLKETTTNPNFYIEVLNITEDKTFYYKFPDNIKRNYKVTLKTIELFQEDQSFICEVANNYLLQTKKNNYTYQELIFIITPLINNHNLEEKYHFNKMKKDIYTSKLRLVREFLEEHYDENFGLGFIIIELNEKSKVIIDFLATKLIEKIFYKTVYNDLEDIIHMNFQTKEELEAYGTNNFIIEFIQLFDEDLAHYASLNPKIYQSINKIINHIIKNWPIYLKENYSTNLKIFFKEVHNILNTYNSSLSFNEICSLVDKKNPNLPLKLSMQPSPKHLNLTLPDYRAIKDVSTLAEELFINNNLNYQKLPEKDSKAKILKFKPKENGVD